MRLITTLSIITLLTTIPMAFAQEGDEIGVVEHLGEYAPIDELTFVDENGENVKFSTLFDRPVVLTLVYFRCPGICTPVLNEVAHAIDRVDLTPNEDYRAITVSFEPDEGPELAEMKKNTMIGSLENVEMPAEGWRFLTGDKENITKLTKAMGFQYQRDKNGIDYIHAGSVMFLTEDGKIVRYLDGLKILPADFEMAVLDAHKGIPRSLIKSFQKLCYTYDPENGAYVVALNRVILGVTGVFVAGFLAFLMFARSIGPKREESSSSESGASGSSGEDAVTGDA